MTKGGGGGGGVSFNEVTERQTQDGERVIA